MEQEIQTLEFPESLKEYNRFMEQAMDEIIKSMAIPKELMEGQPRPYQLQRNRLRDNFYGVM